MYDYGENYKSLCEANCRRYKAYLDIYKKSTDSDGNDTYTYSKTIQSYGSAESIVSIKIVRGQTSGSFSFGNSYSGEMTVIVTPSTQIGKSGDKIIPSVSFIDDEGNETEKAPLGMFFISTITQNDYTKTVKCLDGVVLLDKYYTHLSYDTVGVIITYLAGLLGTTLANDVDDLPNNIRIFGTFKGYDSDGKVINYTRREICNIIASINASNAIFNAQGKLYLTIPDFSTKYEIPSSSVISYTDLNAKNKFTSIYFSDGKESSLPSKIDPQSSDYDPNIMIVNCPIRTYATKEEIETNIEDLVKGVSYDGVKIKKQGTGLYEIGDVLTFTDETRNKSYNNIFVMGITYEISAQNGFTETIYSLAKSETQQQAKGISIDQQISSAQKEINQNVSNDNLTSYKYISDDSVKVNGISYTIEKDDDGLISKIITSDGKTLIPDKSGNITDIQTHNAVVWAVAIAKQLLTSSSAEQMPYMDSIYAYFTPKTMLSDRWKNEIESSESIAYSGGVQLSENGSVIFDPGEYGVYRSTEYFTKYPFTSYHVFKADKANIMEMAYTFCIGQNEYENYGIGFRNTGQLEVTGPGVKFSDTWGYCDFGSKWEYANQYICVAVAAHPVSGARASYRCDIFINGVKQSAGFYTDIVRGSFTCLNRRYWSPDHIERSFLRTEYRFMALGNDEYADDEKIIANCKWAMQKYLI